jgi:hypothetical protein
MLFCLLAELSETTPNEPNHQTLTPFILILPNIWESFYSLVDICFFDINFHFHTTRICSDTTIGCK